LLAVDARSPVMAVAKFREAHVNKWAEYYQDDMLDELLRELERMEIVVFYWLKGATAGRWRTRWRISRRRACSTSTTFGTWEPKLGGIGKGGCTEGRRGGCS
jgi:hypothetical protein